MSAAAPDTAVVSRHYEALRAWATAQPHPAARPTGLAFVLRLGLPGWLAARAVWEPTATGRTAPAPGATARGDRLTAVLTTMVERCRQEGAP